MMSRNFSAYPILLTCLDRVQTVVVGGGQVGERKIEGLLQAHARVRLISPQGTPKIQKWAMEGRLEWLKRCYQPGDLEDAWLVIVATNNRTVNKQVAQHAKQRGLLCNVADVPSDGNFHVPAVYRSEQDIVAVSTSTGNPTRAAALRDQISKWLEAKG